MLFIGLIGLWQGTRLTVNKATQVAEIFNLSQAFVGMAIIAVGTDLPETIISINASLHSLRGMDASGILLGNAIGSSMCQISLVLGIAALFAPHTLAKKYVFRDGGVLVGSVVLLFVVGLGGTVGRLEGGLLLLAYVGYYFFMMKRERTPSEGTQLKIPEKKAYGKVLGIVLLLILGLVIVIAASELVVANAMTISEKLGVRQSFVGIVIVGLGTSLPELSVSVGAAFKRSSSLAVGNILGSNIYDTLMPAGIGAVISPLNMSATLNYFDLPFLMGVSVVTLVMLQTKTGIQRKEALGLIFIYIVYAYLEWSTV